MIPQVNRYSYTFPNPRDASKEGLVAWGGDLNPNRILSAYRQGIFPWYNENDPILWWSPDPRLVLYFDDLKIEKLPEYENFNFKQKALYLYIDKAEMQKLEQIKVKIKINGLLNKN